MSTSHVPGSNVNGVAGATINSVVEHVASQTTTVIKVSDAAINPVVHFDVAQQIINNVHTFTGLNWYGGLFSGTRILYFFAGSEDYFIVTGLGVLLHNLFRHVMSSYFIRGFIPVILPPQISKMAEKVASFKTGGALWFTDLTTADTSFIFPLLIGLTFWIAVEVSLTVFSI
ncbi:PREDICTED: mitochondrial inner membrane protein OXA1 [Camelina sativa]|uniref:Mitochondrial inner membrane protein OXA1 n=1 Tax=Camelina sativa TaxID=90675 RepID=A0ABM1RS99_CAMSA|nr:PREDICTED: mitochondrial inner membrane protein OXA1 [Camelina sativa]